MSYSNLHTHTAFCDGRDAPEDLVLEALRLGCPALGFSGHSHVPFDDCCMSVSGTEEYKNTVAALKKKYAGRIKLLLGVEQDYFADLPADGYDYVIGAAHYIYVDGGYYAVDESREKQLRLVNGHFGGDFYALAESYFDMVGRLYEKTRCDIVAHFDLVTKFNEGGALFDTAAPRYRRAALGALEKLLRTPAAFEINTGAIARGYRTEPYPEPFILREIVKSGARVILSSDCHRREQLLFGFGAAENALAKCRNEK